MSPAAVNATAADPDANADHLSAGCLVALAGRLAREVGTLARRAGATGKRLPTLTIDTQMDPPRRIVYEEDWAALMGKDPEEPVR